jgi:uncharacterized OB-fold protein
MGAQPFREPFVDELSQQWLDGALDGVLLIQRCTACGHTQFYPRAHCAHCLVPDPVWVQAEGRGVVYSFSEVMRASSPEFKAETPYVLALIDLVEGPRMTARIVDAELGSVTCNAEVRVDFRDFGSGHVMPVFMLAGG